MRKSIILICVAYMMCGNRVDGQQDPLFGQYIFNNTIINPAQAGVFKENQAGFLHRNQWVGFEGAPTTTSVFGNFKLDNVLGGAFGIYQDRIGPVKETSIQVDLSYALRISGDWALSAGIRVRGTNTTANLSELKNIQNGDPSLNGTLTSGFVGNLGLGILAYSTNAFLGLAIPQAMSRIYETDIPTNTVLPNNIYFYGGITLPFLDDWDVMGSYMFKKGIGSPGLLDMHLIFKYQDKFDIGPMFRVTNAIGVLTGWRFSEKWYIGYQFEFPINAIQQGSFHTHELALRFYWDSKFRPVIKSPRYFM